MVYALINWSFLFKIATIQAHSLRIGNIPCWIVSHVTRLDSITLIWILQLVDSIVRSVVLCICVSQLSTCAVRGRHGLQSISMQRSRENCLPYSYRDVWTYRSWQS